VYDYSRSEALMTTTKSIVAVAGTFAAVGLLVWWMQSEPRRVIAEPSNNDAGPSVPALRATLPPIDAGFRQLPDARLTDAAITIDGVREHGAVGAPVSVYEEYISREVEGPYWKRDPGQPLTWRGPNDVVVAARAARGRITGVRLSFGKKSASPELQGASGFLTGVRCALQPPGSDQADTTKGTQRSGEFECNGKTLYYKGEVSFDGGPGRPLWFEYSTSPLP
jgi:hypothetical protein